MDRIISPWDSKGPTGISFSGMVIGIFLQEAVFKHPKIKKVVMRTIWMPFIRGSGLTPWD
jgi:hypothetical protein